MISNRWNADIIHADGEGYRAIFSFENGSPDICIEWAKTWKDLTEAITRATGIRIPQRKYFSFCKLSDYEQLAGIDASHVRPTCIVNGWDRRRGWTRESF